MIKRCRTCGGTGWKVTTSAKGGQILKDKCIYCSGKGYTHIIEEEGGIKDAILEQKNK